MAFQMLINSFYSVFFNVQYVRDQLYLNLKLRTETTFDGV